MTFNQWGRASDLPASVRADLEEIWNQLISAGNSNDKAGRLLSDAVDGLEEFYREKYRRW